MTGTARSKAKAAHAVTLARQVKGVKSVKNNVEITPPETAARGDKKPSKDRTAEKRRSDQPVDDTWITTKVKAKFVENKQVSATNINVKTVNGVVELTVKLSDGENGQLNPLAVNCLRAFPVTGRVVWGARTLRGADQLASEWKYLPVRRLALFLEESLFRGSQWVVFEPNDEPLWAQIRLNAGAFMQGLFRQGAFQGSSPRDAYFVKCDRETTTQNDINLGVVNIVVGFAPLKPAEFVVIKIQQIAGQIQT